MSTISSIIWNLWKIVLFSWRCFACASLLVKNHGQNLPKWDEKKERLQYKNEEYRNSFSGKFNLDMLIRKLDFFLFENRPFYRYCIYAQVNPWVQKNVRLWVSSNQIYCVHLVMIYHVSKSALRLRAIAGNAAMMMAES